MKTLLCDCNRTMPLDRPALAKALAQTPGAQERLAAHAGRHARLAVGEVAVAFAIAPDGTLTFTPAANFSGQDVDLKFSVTDGTASREAFATLDITPVNDVPTTSAVTLTAIAEDSGVRVITKTELLGQAGDVEINTLTVSNVAIASGNGTLVARRPPVG